MTVKCWQPVWISFKINNSASTFNCALHIAGNYVLAVYIQATGKEFFTTLFWQTSDHMYYIQTCDHMPDEVHHWRTQRCN